MYWHVFKWAKDVAFNPKKHTKKEYKYDEFIKRLAIVSLIPGVLLTLFAAASGEMIAIFTTIPIFLLSAVVSPFINGAIAHFFGKILFGLMKKKYKKTYNAYAYSAVPGFLFGWIPIVGGFIAAIWAIFVGVHALSNQQKITKGRALLVMFIPLIVALVIAVGVGIYLVDAVLPNIDFLSSIPAYS